MIVLFHGALGVLELIASFSGPFAVGFTKIANSRDTFLQLACLDNFATSLTTSIVTNWDIVTALLHIIAYDSAKGVTGF